MADKNLLQLPLATTAAGALVYGIQNNIDVAIPANVLQGSEQPQGANLVYAGPPQAPGGFPTFRPLVQADIPDLSNLYLSSNGGSLVGATINNSTFIGGSISGSTATFDDDKFTLRDQLDTTKQARFELNGIAAGTLRTFTFPDISTVIVGTNAQQDLTNKTLVTVAGTSARAPVRIPHGQAPSAPVNGDVWTTNAGMYVQANNATIGPLAAAASSTVTTFNGRQGAVTLTNGDVTTALGYTPWNTATNLTTSSNINAGAITGTTVSDASGNLRTAIDSVNTAKVNRAGDTMTGGLAWTFGGNVMRVANNGGNARLEMTNAAQTAFANLSMKGEGFDIDSGVSTFKVTTSQIQTALPAIPTGAFAGYVAARIIATPGSNVDNLQTQYYRSNGSTGTSWSDFSWRFGRLVDTTPMTYLQFEQSGSATIVTGNGGGVFGFGTNGALTANGGFGPGSDPRLKDESSLKKVDNALEKVYNLNVRCGRYNDWYNSDGKDRVFLMADEAMESNTPEVFQRDLVTHDDSKYNGWSADQMIALLTKAVQELTDNCLYLKAEIKKLKESR